MFTSFQVSSPREKGGGHNARMTLGDVISNEREESHAITVKGLWGYGVMACDDFSANK